MNQDEKNIVNEHVADNYRRFLDKLEGELEAGYNAAKKYHAENNAELFKAQSLANLALQRNIQELQDLEKKARAEELVNNKGLTPQVVAWVKQEALTDEYPRIRFTSKKGIRNSLVLYGSEVEREDREVINWIARYYKQRKSLGRLKAHLNSLGVTCDIKPIKDGDAHYANLKFASIVECLESEALLAALGWPILGPRARGIELLIKITPVSAAILGLEK